MKRWAAIATSTLLAQAALAHHSTSRHDRVAPITIDAEVVELRWVNPHSSLTVVDTRVLRFGPLRNGDAGGIFMEATLADGKVMTYSTELPTE